ncbi:MAG: alcohol dehydrogenase [Bacteroidetes bacterium]|nr:MAG: alcohol dehydrogenase [Bacteroidota bacterium]
MKAWYLIRNGAPEKAFELREAAQPVAKAGEVLIKVEAFGLNFADIMARKGLYQDCPPLPALLGYDSVGRIEQVGPGVSGFQEGDRVTAMSRFGSYAEYVCTDARAVARIPEDMDLCTAGSLTTQAGTAWFMAEEMIRLHKNDHVLIQNAAGGVGMALVQMVRRHGCTIYGTAGSPEKLEFLKKLGVHHPINYRTQDFAGEIRRIRGKEGLDVIFDAIGGKTLHTGLRLLGAGGRMVSYGASAMTEANNLFARIRTGLAFGFYHPVFFIGQSRSLIGVNMLRIADNHPEKLGDTFRSVVALAETGELSPTAGGIFPADKLPDAHAFLESRKAMGKVMVKW